MPMQLTEQQLWTLNQLGIPVWQQRQPPVVEPLPEQQSADAETAQVKTVRSSVSVLICLPETDVTAERHLLANILKVMAHLGITAGQCSLDDLTALADAQAMPEQILIMGNQPADLSAMLAKRCLILPSLNDLLSAPHRKAEVWKTLCQLQQNVA